MTVRPSDLPPRPDFGKLGTSFKLRTNFFPVKIPKRILYEYDIAIVPSTTVKRVRRRIFQIAEGTPDWVTHGLRGNVAHDHSAKAVAANKLPQPLVIKIVFSDEDQPEEKKPKEFTLTFTYTKDLDTSTLLEFVFVFSRLAFFSTPLSQISYRSRQSIRYSTHNFSPQPYLGSTSKQYSGSRCHGRTKQIFLPSCYGSSLTRRWLRSLEGILFLCSPGLERTSGQCQCLHYGFLYSWQSCSGYERF
jgi:hypothetical protein